MDYENTTIGVQNISTNASTSSRSVDSYLGDFAEVFSSQFAGSTELTGVAALTLMGFMLFKADVSEDVSAAVLVPATFLFASEGFLPYGQGVLYALILSISGIFIFGLIKYIDR